MDLMIVEDELRLLNSLANNIPWEAHAIEVVALASDGKEALSVFERKQPEIIIMDIVMPEQDGLSLSREILQRMPDTRIIVLSGHDDFQYAQRAVEIGVFKYLLKPAGDEEIVKAVTEAAAAARSLRENRLKLEDLQTRWTLHLPRLRVDFLRDWVNGKFADDEIDDHVRQLSLALEAGRRYCVVAAEVDPLLRAEASSGKEDLPLLQFSLFSIASEWLRSAQCEVFQAYNGTTVLIFKGAAGEKDRDLLQRTNQSVKKLVSSAHEYLKVTTSSAGIGLAVGRESVAVSYMQARKALQERAVLGHEIVISYHEHPKEPRAFEFQRDLEKRVLIALETSDKTEAAARITSIVGDQVASLDTLRNFQEYMLFLQSLLTRIIHAQGWSVLDVLGDDTMELQTPEAVQTRQQMREWSGRMIDKIIGYAEAERKSGTHRLIRNVHAMIEASMDQDVTLHTVADRLYINSSYLSRLFKKETGRSFSDYVLEQKMNKARELLQTGLKVSDAARMTGYMDASYFIKLFRKFWGVTPGELKR
ncbi:response regulator [Paenibacillus rhizovicinus]|uniref:Response regulator n=1 Tax=Paenibacillus rhizovicinus TaxID=2704463 RepID=A0A6C0PAV6_9BACL|nr:response regulator [Paenibacillus rhizovicinus]QHW33692.1 response regulator [Paenibacillus rhizovicinus]